MTDRKRRTDDDDDDHAPERAETDTQRVVRTFMGLNISTLIALATVAIGVGSAIMTQDRINTSVSTAQAQIRTDQNEQKETLKELQKAQGELKDSQARVETMIQFLVQREQQRNERRERAETGR